MNTETGSDNTLWFRFISGLKLTKTNNSTIRANTATRKSPKPKSRINGFVKVPNTKNNMENGRRSIEKGRPEIKLGHQLYLMLFVASNISGRLR